MLLAHQVLVRGVAREHDGAVELLGEELRPRRVALDELDLVVGLECARQAQADVAAAGEQHALHRLVRLAQLAHHLADVLAGGDEEDFVVGLDDGGPLGDDRPALPEDGRDPRVDPRHVLAQGAQLLAHEWPAVVGLDRDQAHPAAGEVEHLHRARGLHQALDVVGDELLGADHHVDRERLLAEELGVVEVLPGPHACDFGGGVEEGVGHLTGDHVGLVTVGDREDHVGVRRPRLLQDIGVGAAPEHGADVEAVAQALEPGRVGVDHGDVVRLARQVLRDRAAHLASAEDDDLHVPLMCRSCTAHAPLMGRR